MFKGLLNLWNKGKSFFKKIFGLVDDVNQVAKAPIPASKASKLPASKVGKNVDDLKPIVAEVVPPASMSKSVQNMDDVIVAEVVSPYSFELGSGTLKGFTTGGNALPNIPSKYLKVGDKMPTLASGFSENAVFRLGSSEYAKVSIRELEQAGLFKSRSELIGGTVYVGRSPENHAFFNIADVSRKHLEITKMNTFPPTYLVTNIGLNGTTILRI